MYEFLKNKLFHELYTFFPKSPYIVVFSYWDWSNTVHPPPQLICCLCIGLDKTKTPIPRRIQRGETAYLIGCQEISLHQMTLLIYFLNLWRSRGKEVSLKQIDQRE